jgi:hypothetical protein
VPAKVSRIAVVAVICLSLGLHWTVLQSVAWATMFASFSRVEPIAAALGKTFDGKHPCNICKFVQSGKGAEQKQELKKPVSKLECSLAARFSFIVVPMPPSATDFPRVFFPDSRGDPPTPPPRFVTI